MSKNAIARPRVDISDPSRETLRRALRGRPADPPWSRPALLGVTLLAALLMLWSLTASGYANTYYASAVYAGSHSWSAFFNNAVDLSQYVAIDKTPLSIWMMSLSARIFGFGSFSMLLPNALCGIASVLVLYDVVRRTLGHRAAILAALILALTPVTVLMSRFNNPDALLVLLLVCAAWATVRATETGRTRHLVLSGVLVGLAFNTKMLQAYLVLPALGITYLYAGPGRVPRRLVQTLGAGAVMFAVSAAWIVTMTLIPASQRPYVGDTAHNSWWELIFAANGLDRVGSGGAFGGAGHGGGGPGGGGGFGGDQGALRLFNMQVGGQIAWLLPLALLGLIVGLWAHRRAGRIDRARAAYLLWGVWAIVHFVIFSFSLNLFHPYYTSALAPAVAVLASGGLVVLWERARGSRVTSGMLAASLVGTGVLTTVLLGRTPSFAPWLRGLVLGAALASAVAVLLRRGHWRALVGAVAVGAVLAGPAAYSIATVGRSIGGGDPTAGPAVAAHDGFPGGGPRGTTFGGGARAAFPAPPAGMRLQGPPPGLGARGLGGSGGLGARGLGGSGILGGRGGLGGGGLGGGGTADKQLVSYLKAHRGGAKYLVAANGSMTAAPIILATHQPAITMGGFGGQDPSPTVAQLKRLIAAGQLRYVLIDGFGGGGPGAPRGSASATQSRQSWVTTSCKAVSGHSGLYDCSSAA